MSTIESGAEYFRVAEEKVDEGGEWLPIEGRADRFPGVGRSEFSGEEPLRVWDDFIADGRVVEGSLAVGDGGEGGDRGIVSGAGSEGVSEIPADAGGVYRGVSEGRGIEKRGV